MQPRDRFFGPTWLSRAPCKTSLRCYLSKPGRRYRPNKNAGAVSYQVLSCLHEAAEKSWEGAELRQKSTTSHILEETSNPKPLLICPSECMFFSQRFPGWRRGFFAAGAANARGKWPLVDESCDAPHTERSPHLFHPAGAGLGVAMPADPPGVAPCPGGIKGWDGSPAIGARGGR